MIRYKIDNFKIDNAKIDNAEIDQILTILYKRVTHAVVICGGGEYPYIGIG